MEANFRIFFLLSLVYGTLGQSDLVRPPIPLLATEPGEIYGSGTGESKVKLEAFIELNCGDSVRAWPELKAVADHYQQDVAVKIHHFVLPYHRNALLCTKGYYQVLDKDPENVWSYQSAVLDDYASFLDGNTRNKTEIEIIRYLSELAENVTNIKKGEFFDDLQLYSSESVYKWKYAIKRGAAGTPWYFINGIDLAVNPSVAIDAETWKQVIDPLLGLDTTLPASTTSGTTASGTSYMARKILKKLEGNSLPEKEEGNPRSLAEEISHRIQSIGLRGQN